MTSASASRVTRSRRSLHLALLLAAGVLAGVTVLRAQESAPPATPAQGDALPPSSATPRARPGEPGQTGRGDPAPPGATAQPPAPAGSTPSRFEPTEKVRADFDVSFPIDI